MEEGGMCYKVNIGRLQPLKASFDCDSQRLLIVPAIVG